MDIYINSAEKNKKNACIKRFFGALGGIRTPDLPVRRREVGNKEKLLK